MADNDRYRDQDHSRDRLGQRDVYLDNRTGVGAPGRGYRAEWSGGERGRSGDREENYNMRRAENPSFREHDYGQQEGGRSGYRNRESEDRYGGGSSQSSGEGRGWYSEQGSYGQGGRWSRNRPYEDYGQGRYSQSGSRYAAGDQMSRDTFGRGDRDDDRSFASYPARSNPDFYADEYGSAGAGWTESYGERDRDRSLEAYRGQNREQGRGRRHEGDYERHRGGTGAWGQTREGRHGGAYGQGPGIHGPTAYSGTHSYEADYTEGPHDEPHGRGGGLWNKVTNFFTGEDEHRQDRQTHRGRGPQGYRRSDERIREDVNDRLTDDHWLDASSIDVRVENCDVILTGTVKSREDKRRAEQLAEEVSGVDNVQNNLRVERQGDWARNMSVGQGAGMGLTGGQGMPGNAVSGSGGSAGTGSNLGGGQSTGGSMSGAAGSGTIGSTGAMGTTGSADSSSTGASTLGATGAGGTGTDPSPGVTGTSFGAATSPSGTQTPSPKSGGSGKH